MQGADWARENCVCIGVCAELRQQRLDLNGGSHASRDGKLASRGKNVSGFARGASYGEPVKLPANGAYCQRNENAEYGDHDGLFDECGA